MSKLDASMVNEYADVSYILRAQYDRWPNTFETLGFLSAKTAIKHAERLSKDKTCIAVTVFEKRSSIKIEKAFWPEQAIKEYEECVKLRK